MAKRPRPPARLPSKAEIARFLGEQTGKIGKREIARAFGITGDDRIELKRLLAEMKADGLVERERGRGLVAAGDLPAVAVLQIAGSEAGVLLARAVSWPPGEPQPRIELVEERGARRTGPAPAVGDRVLARLEKLPPGPEGERSYLARVIRTLSREEERLLGVIRVASGGEIRLVPADRRARTEYRIDAADLGGARDGDLVAAEAVIGRALGLPRARVREVLGDTASPKSIALIAIHAHGIPVAFPPAALDQAAQAQPVAPGGREDLRALPLITIDPADARDHDDAVFAEADPDPANPGGHHVVVAIADVAHYVRPGSPLDHAARERGNSVYFPDRVVPMLPEALSSTLCSLLEGEDRACLAIHLWLDGRGAKLRHRFTRAVIRIAAGLSYEQAQAGIEGRADAATAPLVEPVLRPLWAAWEAVMVERARREPLDIDVAERIVRLDPESGAVLAVEPRLRLDAHRVIEEFMILANVAAAETLEERRQPCMYRVHDEPSVEKLEALRSFLATLGIRLAKGQALKPHHFNRILAQATGSPQVRAVNEMVLRAQAQAVYSPENLGHFGLALRRYAHFTSPIRRYADILVHRALTRGLGLGEGGLGDDEIPGFADTAQHISMTERRAMAAERDSTDRYLAAFMAEKVGARFTARVTGVTRFGLFVTLDESGATGLVPVSTLGADYFRHDEGAQALIGERGGLAFRLGDLIKVTLREASPITGGLVFVPADRPAGGPPGRGATGGRKPLRGTPRRPT